MPGQVQEHRWTQVGHRVCPFRGAMEIPLHYAQSVADVRKPLAVPRRPNESNYLASHSRQLTDYPRPQESRRTGHEDPWQSSVLTHLLSTANAINVVQGGTSRGFGTGKMN